MQGHVAVALVPSNVGPGHLLGRAVRPGASRERRTRRPRSDIRHWREVTTDFGTDAIPEEAAAQPDGKIVAAGGEFGSQWRFALARYLPNGALDLSFGSDGKVTTGFGGNCAFGDDMALQPDGKIVVAGEVFTGEFTSEFHLIENPKQQGCLLRRGSPVGSLEEFALGDHDPLGTVSMTRKSIPRSLPPS